MPLSRPPDSAFHPLASSGPPKIKLPNPDSRLAVLVILLFPLFFVLSLARTQRQWSQTQPRNN